MSLPTYVDASEYATLTGRVSTEAALYRINMASRLLDARIQCDPMSESDIDDLTEAQQYAVQLWVAWMIAFMVDNNDSVPDKTYIRLGRFEQRNNVGDSTRFAKLDFAERILINSGLCNCVMARIR
jgi:hypothetical protein